MAIIGVVAAIVIPLLMKNTNDMEHKSAWKKSYSDLAQAAKLLLVDNPSGISGTDTQIKRFVCR
jgi:type II secretory pathway pseudopilin PulG